MNSDTERLILDTLEFLVAREGIFLEGQIAEGEHLLRASINESVEPHIDALRGLKEDRDQARELLNRLMAAK